MRNFVLKRNGLNDVSVTCNEYYVTSRSKNYDMIVIDSINYVVSLKDELYEEINGELILIEKHPFKICV